jgi:hypothetical protein
MTNARSTALAHTILLIALITVPRLATAQKLSDAEMKTIGASATTVADHKKLAAHYRAHAVEHEADAKVHEVIVAAARKQNQASGHAWELARGAAHYAEHSREAAEALRELAVLHEGMAEVAANPTRISQ